MLKNFKTVSPGIFRSAEPTSIDDFNFIKSQNIRYIIDLENEAGEAPEEAKFCKEAGIYLLFSVPLSSYAVPDKLAINDVLTFIDSFKDEGVLVHCKHGQDRTGLIVGMYRRLYERVDKWIAWKEMIDNGFHRALFGLTYYYWRN